MRYLIVGYGNIGHKRKDALGKKCIATADPIPKAEADFKNYKDVPIDIFDTAVLTVPQQNKLELIKYFLLNRKHILVEKPLIINKEEYKTLNQLATRNNLVVQTSYNHRFEPNMKKFTELLESGFLGKIYHGTFIYSFGNIQERIGTWREKEYSVLEEIAPHLLDIIINHLDYKGKDFVTFTARKEESNIFDHWVFSTSDHKIIVETSSITWKNTFLLELFGSLGSIHLSGLQKWEGSELIIRKRVFPSGKPIEKRIFRKGLDNTWKEDFREFEKNVNLNKNSLQNDLKLSKALAHIVLTAPNTKDPQRNFYRQILK